MQEAGKKMQRKPIRSFRDLEVYENTYKASIIVISKVIPNLPKEERFDLADQLRRSSKAVPRLIAEGYSKKHQVKNFKKYLDDAIGESNETIVSLSHVRDLYERYVDTRLCDDLIDIYDKSGRQMFNLAVTWKDFGYRKNIQPQASASSLETSFDAEHLGLSRKGG
jgi:four helix bundle protein